MRRFAFLPLAALPLVLAVPAAAQVAPGYSSFTGLRVQGLAGWDRTQSDGDHSDGVLYGVGVGYDVQRGGILVGVDGEISDSTARDCFGARSLADPRVCANAGRDLYAGARIGTLLTPRTLVYAKAGYTNARYGFRYNDGIDRERYARDLDGLRVGGGVEYALGPNTFVNAEYRYSNYQDGISRNQIVGGFGVRF